MVISKKIFFFQVVLRIRSEMDEAVDFCRELMELRVSFRMDIMNRLYNGSNDYGVGWKKRCIVVNGNDYNLMEYMKKLRLNM